jgi:hypothetical protein
MKNKITVIGLLFLCMAGTVSAGQESGFYLGVAPTGNRLHIDHEGTRFNDTTYGGKLFGGYNLGVVPLLDLGVEGSYLYFGEASSSGRDVDLDGFNLCAVGAINLGPFGIFAKAGGGSFSTDSNLAALDDSSESVVYGGGVRLQFRSLAFRVEYERIEADIVDVDSFSIGVAWTF